MRRVSTAVPMEMTKVVMVIGVMNGKRIIIYSTHKCPHLPPPFVVRLLRCFRVAIVSCCGVPADWDGVAADVVVLAAVALLWNCLRRELVDSCGNGDACRNCNGD